MADLNVAKIAYTTAKARSASDRVILALFEAGLVESDMRNLNYGDLDSLGFLQQRSSWGTALQRQNVAYATGKFLDQAIILDKTWSGTAGKLAQAVQKSAFPYKYDLKENEAKNLIKQVSGINIDNPNNTNEDIGVIDFITTPISSFNKLVNNLIEDSFNQIAPFIVNIGLYIFIVIIIFLSFGMVYAQDTVKTGVKTGVKTIKKVAITAAMV